MQPAHDPHYDGKHHLSEHCNSALAPIEAAQWFAEAPQPTPGAAREWQRTVAAEEISPDLASGCAHAAKAATHRSGASATRAALIIAAIVIALLLWSLSRPRKAEAPEAA